MTASKETLYISAGLLLILAANLFLQSFVLLSADVALYLNAAERILAGEKMYEDIVDANFPTQFYLYTLPVFLSKFMGISLVAATKIFVDVLALASYVVVLILARNTPLCGEGFRRVTFILIIAFVFFLIPLTGANEFGQKEHFVVLFAMPYFMLCYRRLKELPTRTALAMLAGAMAGLAFLIKPHFLLFLIGSEAYVMWRNKSIGSWLRPEVISIGIVWLLLLILLFPAWERYVRFIIPLVPFYILLGQEALTVTLMSIIKVGSLLLPMVVFWNTIKQSTWRGYLFIVFIAGAGVVVSQQKGWVYHFLPVVSIGFIVLMDMLAGVVNEWKRNGRKKNDQSSQKMWVLAFYCGLMLFLEVSALPLNPAQDAGRERGMVDALDETVQRYAANNKIYLFSEHSTYAFPFVVTRDLDWHYSFYHLWLLIGMKNYEYRHGANISVAMKEKLKRLEAMLRERMTADLLREQPSILFVAVNERAHLFQEEAVDYIRYFLEYQPFAEFMRHYAPEARVLDYRNQVRFIVYVRRDINAAQGKGT